MQFVDLSSHQNGVSFVSRGLMNNIVLEVRLANQAYKKSPHASVVMKQELQLKRFASFA